MHYVIRKEAENDGVKYAVVHLRAVQSCRMEDFFGAEQITGVASNEIGLPNGRTALHAACLNAVACPSPDRLPLSSCGATSRKPAFLGVSDG